MNFSAIRPILSDRVTYYECDADLIHHIASTFMHNSPNTDVLLSHCCILKFKLTVYSYCIV